MISAGNFTARCVSAKLGTDKQNRPTAFIDVELTSGPDAGQRITYRGLLSDVDKAKKYVLPCLKAAGWTGRDIETLATDVDAARAEVPIEIEHREWDGKTFPSVRNLGERTNSSASAKPLPPGEAKNINAMLGLGDDGSDEATPF